MIFDEIGLDLLPITRQYLLCRNEWRQYDHCYHKCLDVKNCHYATKKENIQKDLQKKATDAKEGMDYGPSVDIDEIDSVAANVEQSNVEGVQVENNSETVAPEGTNNTCRRHKMPQRLVECSNCHYMGHRTWRSAAAKNTASILRIFNNMVSDTCV